MLTFEEIKFNIVSESNIVVYRNFKDIIVYKNPCMVVMFGGDNVATRIASNIGIDLGENGIASVVQDHSFWIGRINDITIDDDTRRYVEKDAKSGCVKIISIGMGVFMVYDQNIRHACALFN